MRSAKARNGRRSCGAVRSVRCAIYVRTAVPDDEAASRQRLACAAFIDQHAELGWRRTDAPYQDVGASGMTLDREGMTSLLADADAGRFDVLVIRDVARLSRSQLQLQQILNRLRQSGVEVVERGP